MLVCKMVLTATVEVQTMIVLEAVMKLGALATQYVMTIPMMKSVGEMGQIVSTQLSAPGVNMAGNGVYGTATVKILINVTLTLASAPMAALLDGKATSATKDVLLGSLVTSAKVNAIVKMMTVTILQGTALRAVLMGGCPIHNAKHHVQNTSLGVTVSPCASVREMMSATT